MAFGTSQQSGPDCVGFMDNFNANSWGYVADFMEDRNGSVDFVVQVDWAWERTMGSCGLPPDQFLMEGETGGLDFGDPPQLKHSDPYIEAMLAPIRLLAQVDACAIEYAQSGVYPTGKGWTKEHWERFKTKAKESKWRRTTGKESQLKRAETIRRLKAECVKAGFREDQWNEEAYNEHGYRERIWEIAKRTQAQVRIPLHVLINSGLPIDKKAVVVHGVPMAGPATRPWPVSVTIRS